VVLYLRRGQSRYRQQFGAGGAERQHVNTELMNQHLRFISGGKVAAAPALPGRSVYVSIRRRQSLPIAIGCGGDNPDNMLKDWPQYEKSGADDVDYEFIASMVHDPAGKLLPELQRLAAPGTNKQTYYDTNAPTSPAIGLMDATPTRGAQGRVAIVYDSTAHVLRYEIAIPWSQIEGLHEKVDALQRGQSTSVHLAFRFNDTGDASHGGGFWTTEAGDVEAGAYGFSPHWGGGQPSQGGRIITDWGFVRNQ
jgi:hypothetical protein